MKTNAKITQEPNNVNNKKRTRPASGNNLTPPKAASGAAVNSFFNYSPGPKSIGQYGLKNENGI